MNRKKISAISFILVLFIAIFGLIVFPANAENAAATELAALMGNIKGADGSRYGSKDSKGYVMDGAKIIENPAVPGQFLAIYHAYTGQFFQVHVASSVNLLEWTYLVTLGGEKGKSASQPAIKALGTGFVVVWEQEPKNHIRFLYYDDFNKLKAAQYSKNYACTRKLSSYAEGTPSIYSATENTVEIGFHYYYQGKYDRQASGVMKNWNSWECKTEPKIDAALLATGARADRNIGDRDFIEFKGSKFLLIEANGNNGNFGDWRSHIYDIAANEAIYVNMKSKNGSGAFANPTGTLLRYNNRDAIVFTVFIPSENSKSGEAGSCIYYFYLSPKPAESSSKAPSSSKVISNSSQQIASINQSDETKSNITESIGGNVSGNTGGNINDILGGNANGINDDTVGSGKETINGTSRGQGKTNSGTAKNEDADSEAVYTYVNSEGQEVTLYGEEAVAELEAAEGNESVLVPVAVGIGVCIFLVGAVLSGYFFVIKKRKAR